MMSATVLASSAPVAGAATPKTPKMTPIKMPPIKLGDGFFLSRTNPLATVDQRDLEALALKAMDMPVIRAALESAAQRFKMLGGREVPAEAWRDWDQRMWEWTYHYLLLGLNADPNYPKVLISGYGPPHEWFGMKVPGCRGPGTAENPDNNYSFIPIDGRAHFELHGRRMNPPVGDCVFYVTCNLSQTDNVAELDGRDIEYDADGNFVITIGPDAGERKNHLRTTPDSRFVFIRDSRTDWGQVANAYRIHRLDPPDAPMQTFEQQIDLAARFIVDDVAMNYFFKQMTGFLEPNTLSNIAGSATVGGMFSQKLLRGRIRIADDEAYVLHLTSGGAKYWMLSVYDWWGMSGDFWNRTTSLNTGQSAPNPDGSYTYVFSIRDPGVHNWIDTLGFHEPIFWNRWRVFPRTAMSSGDGPTARGEVVKLSQLGGVLPITTKLVNSDERARQIADRHEAFLRRYAV